MENAPAKTRKLVVGVTVGASAVGMLRGQLAWLQERGWDVTLVTTPDEKAKIAAEREDVTLEGVQMSRNISLKADIRALLGWIRVLRNLRPDAVSVGTPKAGLLGILAAWVTRVPRRVYVVRGLRLEGASSRLVPLLWVMERLTTALATDVVPVSRSLGAELVRRRLTDPRKTWLVGDGSSNGVDALSIGEKVRKADPEKLRSALNLGSKFVVGFIGRVRSDKGIETLFEALRHLGPDADVETVVLGAIEDGFKANLASDIKNHVHFVGRTDEVASYLAIIDLLVLPTHREGFPNVVLEAAAAGVPAITTRATGAIDSVIDGQTGYLIDVGDSRSLAEYIRSLSIDVETRQNMGKEAKQRVLRDFQPERIWNGLNSILNGEPNSDVLCMAHVIERK